MITRKQVVTQARTWIGTPFHHQGRVKHVGVDCIGLLVGVIKELGIKSTKKDNNGNLIPLESFDNTNYGRLPDGVLLQTSIEKHFYKVERNNIKPGDVLLFKFDENPQHIGIATDYPTDGLGLIHCYQCSGKVVEHIFSKIWHERLIEGYRVKRFDCFN